MSSHSRKSRVYNIGLSTFKRSNERPSRREKLERPQRREKVQAPPKPKKAKAALNLGPSSQAASSLTRTESPTAPVRSTSNVLYADELQALRMSLATGGRDESAQRKGARLSGDLSRKMRNEQRNVNRDIASTERAIEKTSDPSQRANLQYRLKVLQSLKQGMAQSYESYDGQRVYTPAKARLDAMNEYLDKFKGAQNMKEQRGFRVRPDMSYAKEFMQGFESKWRSAIEDAFADGGIEFTAKYQELLDEYHQAIRSFDSDEAKRVVSRMASYKVKYYSTRPHINQGRKAK